MFKWNNSFSWASKSGLRGIETWLISLLTYALEQSKSGLRGIETLPQCSLNIFNFKSKSGLRGIETNLISVFPIAISTSKSGLRGIETGSAFCIYSKQCSGQNQALEGLKHAYTRTYTRRNHMSKSGLRGIETYYDRLNGYI